MQISADGKHLVDGVAWGRPLLRKSGDRPAVNIPPRKRQRIEYNEDDEDPEGFRALKEKEAEDSNEDNDRQLVLHADFDDDDEEDDEDFAPGEDEDAEEDGESEEDFRGGDEKEEDENEEEPAVDSRPNREGNDDVIEPALTDVTDEATRSKIRKLHSAFPNSPLAVCKYVFDGSEDIGEAYEAMARGFIAVKSKIAITESSQGVDQGCLSVPKTRSKAKSPSVHESQDLDSMEAEPNMLVDYYDQNGLPPGSIKSGKALSFMAEALKSSPARPRSASRRSVSVTSNKSVRFAPDASFSKGLTSTSFIDKESQVEEEEESEEDSDDSSDDSEGKDDSSSEDSSESSDEEVKEASGAKDSEDDTSASESDSDSSSDSSSEDESPEEASSKKNHITEAPAKPDPTPSPQAKKPSTPTATPPGQGTSQTRTRNQRRRAANILLRYKEKGILPAGTTVAEFQQLDLEETASPETAYAALEAMRAAKKSEQSSNTPFRYPSQELEFEQRRQELLKSLVPAGGEFDSELPSDVLRSALVVSAPQAEMKGIEGSMGEVHEAQPIIDTGPSVVLPGSIDSANESQQSVAARPNVETQVPIESEDIASRISPESHRVVHTATLPQRDSATADRTTASAPPGIAADDSPATTSNLSSGSAKSSQTGSSRRAKLDLGAGKRLLFGALGIKTPKTKEDGEKVRNELMKGVRPLLPKKTTEEPHSVPADDAVDEDPDAWRSKINYSAKECVQDGIVLSEPPFPFEQRWDPQQRGLYNGDRGGKRKKDQRDQAQFYHDDNRASKKQKRRKGKHNYAEEQEYLDASYKPSYQDDTMTSQFDDPTEADRLQSDDMEGEISRQLMNDIQTPNAEFSQGPEDLVLLPEDPSTLPDLKDGEAKVGMTIAFKKLEMSEATQWQPQVSAYLTALVIAMAETGELQLTLAKRDREQSAKRFNPETGERLYSKFEVPDDDEMDDEHVDEGMLSIAFCDLIEPKILEEPPSSPAGDVIMEEASQPGELTSFDRVTLSQEKETANGAADEAAEAQCSHVTETPLNSDAPEPTQAEESLGDGAIVGHINSTSSVEEAVIEDNDIPAATPIEETIVDAVAAPNVALVSTPGADAREKHVADSISEESRQNWTHLMREGGFHSSVPSSLTKLIQPVGTTSPDDLEKLKQDMSITPLNAPYSPKYNGLGSSPIRKPKDVSKSPAQGEREESLQPQSSWETVEEGASSPAPAIESPQKSLPFPFCLNSSCGKRDEGDEASSEEDTAP